MGRREVLVEYLNNGRELTGPSTDCGNDFSVFNA